jgi:hypothetical protein
MNTETNPHRDAGSTTDSRKSTARLIATFGGSQILRHRDGSLDVCNNDVRERNATLAWLCAVSPDLALRVRRSPMPSV